MPVTNKSIYINSVLRKEFCHTVLLHRDYQGCKCTVGGCRVGLFKKHQLWKLKAGRVVSYGFRHAEFNGARKNRFEALLRVANLISIFLKMHGR